MRTIRKWLRFSGCELEALDDGVHGERFLMEGDINGVDLVVGSIGSYGGWKCVQVAAEMAAKVAYSQVTLNRH